MVKIAEDERMGLLRMQVQNQWGEGPMSVEPLLQKGT